MLGLRSATPTPAGRRLAHFTVFILAIFVGFQVVWNVKPALHTPLMSVTNAISGIILVGGMLQLSATSLNLTVILGGDRRPHRRHQHRRRIFGDESDAGDV